MTKPFVAGNYHDEDQERLRQAIMKKIEGQEIVSADAGGPCVVEYMPNTQNALRQPVFKGYRDDVFPADIQTNR